MDDRALDELYSVPIEEFTATRNAIAEKVRAGGDSGGAVEIKKLKKPTVAAWTVNQLAREHPKEIQRLMDLRSEPTEGDAKALRSAAAERRSLIASLTDHARDILHAGGHATGAATLVGVSKTLLAGATEEERDQIRSGRLTRELAPAGFEAVGGLSAAPPEDEIEEPEVEPRAARRAEELAAKAEETERAAVEAERAAQQASKQAEKLAQQAATARRKADEARKRADEAMDKLGR